MTRASVAIRLQRLSAVFHHERRGDVTAVKDLDLDVAPGEFLTLLGASGCGKTTTLRMIAGFQPPHSGRIFFDDDDVTGVPANQRDIGFVFQNYALFPHLSVFENVAYGLRIRRLAAAAIEKGVEDGLAQVGLQGFGERMIGELSGGQQQRVALARAIAIKPRVLLFDEPLSNLDAKLRVQMRGEIARLQRELAITTVYVTHDQDEAMAISSRIAVMHDGRIAQIGTAEELYRNPSSAFVAGFLGSANIIRARVISAENDRATVDLFGQKISASASQSLMSGQSIDVVLRPESIQLLKGKADHGPAATVQTRVYLGARADYVVRCGDTLLSVSQSDPKEADFPPGETVTLGLPASVRAVQT